MYCEANNVGLNENDAETQDRRCVRVHYLAAYNSLVSMFLEMPSIVLQ